MKKIALMMISIVAMLTMTSCTYESIDENQVGILVQRPYLFGSDGTQVLHPGRHVIAESSSLYLMDATPHRFVEKFTNLTTKDKSDVDFDFTFVMKIDPDKADVLYRGWGFEWYERNLEKEFRRSIRNKGMSYDMSLITSDPKIAKEIEDHVIEECRDIIKELKMPIGLVSVSMGKAEPPKEVLDERSATAAAKQRENTLIQIGKNLDQEKENEGKRAVKDQEYMKKMNLSTTQFVQLEQLRVQEVAYKKAQTVIVDGSSQSNPTYNIKN